MKLLIMTDTNELWEITDTRHYAKHLGVSYESLRKQVSRGKYNPIKIGNRNYFMTNRINI